MMGTAARLKAFQYSLFDLSAYHLCVVIPFAENQGIVKDADDATGDLIVQIPPKEISCQFQPIRTFLGRLATPIYVNKCQKLAQT